MEQIQENIRKLGKWFHNIDLRGVKTGSDHFLGDYPSVKFQRFAHAIPEDLHGRTVLDIGCNAGFEITAHPEDKVYICRRRAELPDKQLRAVYPMNKISQG